MFVGEYADGYFYYYSVRYSGEGGMLPINFVKVSTADWTVVSTTPVTSVVDGMAYDYTTGVMYGVRNTNQGSTYLSTVSTLVKINLETGAQTVVGQCGERGFIPIACNTDGQLYGVDFYGNFCAINKTNATVTEIGATGTYPGDFIQSLAFDHNTGRLFWAMVNRNLESRLVEIEPSSGITFDRGMFASNSEITGLYTPLTLNHIIVASAGANGTITPSGDVIVEEGESQTFEITPDTDYKIKDVIVNGVSKGTVTSYTFYNVIADGTIEAYFIYDNSIIENGELIISIFSHNKTVTIINENLVAIQQVEIMDMYGRVVWKGQASDVKTEITLNVTAGIYAVRIITEDNQQLTAKVKVD
jgi:hypothetical protein